MPNKEPYHVPQGDLDKIAETYERRYESIEAEEAARIAQDSPVSARENEVGRIPEPRELDEIRQDHQPRVKKTPQIGSWGTELGRPIKTDADLNTERKLRQTKEVLASQKIMASMSESDREAYKRGIERAREVLENPDSQRI